MRFLYVIVVLFAYCAKQSSPINSFSNKTIVFVNKSENVNHLWLMDIDSSGISSNVRRLTSDLEAENYPSWSPDGKLLSYQRDYNGSAIYIVDVEGKNERRISPTPGFDVTPSWSPDGKHIIYSRLKGFMIPGQVPKTDIRIMNADGTGDHSILPNTDFSVEPRWSVNNQIVFMSLMHGGQQVYTMNTDGTQIRQLTQDGSNGDPVWSPDGSQICFGSNREGNAKLNIFIINNDGTGTKQLTHFKVPVESGDTNFSPDGKQIVFEYDINGHEQSDPNAYAEVWTMNTDGTRQKSTSQSCSSVGCAPRWQPNPF